LEKAGARVGKREHVLMMQLHDGFFLTMGVMGWKRFFELMN
jgi:hypothetical protein